MQTIEGGLETRSDIPAVAKLKQPLPLFSEPGVVSTEVIAEGNAKDRFAGQDILYAECPDRRLKIRTPFLVKVCRYEDGVAAHVAALEEFGVGLHPGDALHDLGKTLAELFFALKNTSDDLLSSDLTAVKETLAKHFEERPR